MSSWHMGGSLRLLVLRSQHASRMPVKGWSGGTELPQAAGGGADRRRTTELRRSGTPRSKARSLAPRPPAPCDAGRAMVIPLVILSRSAGTPLTRKPPSLAACSRHSRSLVERASAVSTYAS